MKRKPAILPMKHFIFIVTIVSLLLTAQSCGPFRAGYMRWEPETKRNLYTIHLAVERYNIENGEYPPFLLGGDKQGWDYYNNNRPDGAPHLCDPLIESGMLVSYPENPLRDSPVEELKARKDRIAFNKFKKQVSRLDGKNFDPRFGLNGGKMGNVLMEPYIFVKQPDSKLKGYPRMCPGQFYYKAFGEVSTYEGFDLSEIRTPDDYEYQEHSYYVLGAFGSVNEPGKDSIRWTNISGNIPSDFPLVSTTDKYRIPEDLNISINLQLPEIIGSGNSKKAPMWPPTGYLNIGNELYRVAGTEKALPGWKYKCPDGVPDGIILILVTGSKKDNAGL